MKEKVLWFFQPISTVCIPFGGRGVENFIRILKLSRLLYHYILQSIIATKAAYSFANQVFKAWFFPIVTEQITSVP